MSFRGSRVPKTVGALVGASATTPVTQALNATATWMAYGFQARSKTLSSIRVFFSAVTGTLAASDLTATLYSDSGTGAPGSAIEAVNCAATPTGNAWNDFTGFTTALTGGPSTGSCSRT